MAAFQSAVHRYGFREQCERPGLAVDEAEPGSWQSLARWELSINLLMLVSKSELALPDDDAGRKLVAAVFVYLYMYIYVFTILSIDVASQGRARRSGHVHVLRVF